MTINVLSIVRKLFRPLKNTVLHPQWLSYRDNVLRGWLQGVREHSRILDIGCNDRWPKKHLHRSCEYIGLDYYDAENSMYSSQVDLYGDAQNLPILCDSIDCILMFDVLEHIPDVELALEEAQRVLVNGGEVLLQIPFIYPIHDAPFDFRRPTKYGLLKLFRASGFEVVDITQRGKPLETVSLLANIALASTVSSMFKTKWLPFAVVVTPFVITTWIALNIVGWLASFSRQVDELMPFSYQIRLRKPFRASLDPS